MQINQQQIEEIRKLVDRAATFEAMQGQLECCEPCSSSDCTEECTATHDYEGIDDGALTELHALAGEVERILDAAPTLPSEIEVAELEDQLVAAVLAESRQ